MSSNSHWYWPKKKRQNENVVNGNCCSCDIWRGWMALYCMKGYRYPYSVTCVTTQNCAECETERAKIAINTMSIAFKPHVKATHVYEKWKINAINFPGKRKLFTEWNKLTKNWMNFGKLPKTRAESITDNHQTTNQKWIKLKREFSW